jgi:hypothetical protein
MVFLETDDEYFDYAPAKLPPAGVLAHLRHQSAGDGSSQSVFRECRSSTESDSLMLRSPQTRIRNGIIACALVFIAVPILTAADPAVMESTKALEDVAPSTDATSPFWRGASLVYAEKAPYGQSQPRYGTEVRSRWTDKNCISYSFVFKVRRRAYRKLSTSMRTLPDSSDCG